MYAGKVCKKCYQGCNNDNNIKFIDEFYIKLEKRFNVSQLNEVAFSTTKYY